MENLKIRVANKREIKEVQDLFFDLGYKWACGKKQNPSINECPTIIRSHDSGCITWSISSEPLYEDHKEINLPELRDLVVLKRNNVGDATHESPIGTVFCVSADSKIYYFNEKWCESHYIFSTDELKPIEKKEMKEYLVKSQDGKWCLETDLVGDPADNVIEVPNGANSATYGTHGDINFFFDFDFPEGRFKSGVVIWQRNPEPKKAEFLVKTDSGYVLQVLDENAGSDGVVLIPDGAEIAILASGVVYFWKSHFFNGGVHKDWVDMKEGCDASWYLKSVPSAITIWQRETLNDQVEYRQAEVLPFIDDEPLLQTTTGIDLDQVAKNNDLRELLNSHTQSLNNQYAEIEKVRQSAWQKQEGGNHYKNLKIQPMQYALENKLDYAQANVIKYVTRHKEKNGKEDLLKAIHNLELMIEFYYGGEK